MVLGAPPLRASHPPRGASRPRCPPPLGPSGRMLTMAVPPPAPPTMTVTPTRRPAAAVTAAAWATPRRPALLHRGRCRRRVAASPAAARPRRRFRRPPRPLPRAWRGAPSPSSAAPRVWPQAPPAPRRRAPSRRGRAWPRPRAAAGHRPGRRRRRGRVTRIASARTMTFGGRTMALEGGAGGVEAPPGWEVVALGWRQEHPRQVGRRRHRRRRPRGGGVWTTGRFETLGPSSWATRGSRPHPPTGGLAAALRGPHGSVCATRFVLSSLRGAVC